MGEFASAPIRRRIELLEDALAKVLDRGGPMSVEADGPCFSDRSVVVRCHCDGCATQRYDLSRIARDLELLLS